MIEADFADLLQTHLSRTGLTAGKLAQLADIPRQTVYKWLEGTRPQEWQRVVKVAAILHLDEDQVNAFLRCAGYVSVGELMAGASSEAHRLLLAPWAKPVLRRFDQALHAVVTRKMDAQDWKQVHEDCQEINLRLIILRGALSDSDPYMSYSALHMHWRMDCSRRIKQLARFEHLADAPVKQELAGSGHHSHWLRDMLNITQEVDLIVTQCATPEQLQAAITVIRTQLSALEISSNELLKYVDVQLKLTLRNLERDIESARTQFIQSVVFTS